MTESERVIERECVCVCERENERAESEGEIESSRSYKITTREGQSGKECGRLR